MSTTEIYSVTFPIKNQEERDVVNQEIHSYQNRTHRLAWCREDDNGKREYIFSDWREVSDVTKILLRLGYEVKISIKDEKDFEMCPYC